MAWACQAWPADRALPFPAAAGFAFAAVAGEAEECWTQDEEEALLEEMGKITSRMKAREKKEQQRKQELRKKARIRAAQLASGEGLLDATDSSDLFSLASIKAPPSLPRAQCCCSQASLVPRSCLPPSIRPTRMYMRTKTQGPVHLQAFVREVRWEELCF